MSKDVWGFEGNFGEPEPYAPGNDESITEHDDGSATIEVDLEDTELSALIEIYIRENFSSATQDHIEQLFPDGITPDNMKDAAFNAVVNEAAISVLEHMIKVEKEKNNVEL